jgi:hypothetical protein
MLLLLNDERQRDVSEKQAIKIPSWRSKLVACRLALGQVFVLVAVACMLFLPPPFTNLLPAGWLGSDLTISHWPTALLLQRTFAREHQLPLWNPYFAGGQPLGADPLAALFYPPTHLVHFLSLRNYYLVLILGHSLFAGLGMLLLARRALKLPPLPALVAAVSFMATPRLVSHLGAGHVTIFQAVSWFPWLALSCWATVRAPRRWGVGLGLCIALTLLAGHPQMAYYGLLMTVCQAAWLLVGRWRREGRRALLLTAAGLVAAGGTGALVAAVHLVPLLEFTALSTREHAVASSDAYPLRDFLWALVDPRPRLRLPWEGMLTPGLAVLALALFALVTRWRRVWPLLLGIVFVAGLAMGNSSPIHLLVSRILTSLQFFRGLARVWFVGLFLIALLAGIGADALLSVIGRFSLRATVPSGCLVVFVVALTLVVNREYAGFGDIDTVTAPTHLARVAASVAGDGCIYALQSNIQQEDAAEMEGCLASGQGPLLIDSYDSYMQRAGNSLRNGYHLYIPVYDSPAVQPDARLLGLMHVSVVVSSRPLTDPRLVLVGKEDGTLLYKNIAYAGPAYLVQPRADGGLPSLDQVEPLNSTVRTITLAPSLREFTFSSKHDAYFVIATALFPGWTAFLDGQPVTVQSLAGALPAIKVGPGTHTLSYRYDPPSVRLGALLSLVGLLVVLIWFLVGWRFLLRKR